MCQDGDFRDFQEGRGGDTNNDNSRVHAVPSGVSPCWESDTYSTTGDDPESWVRDQKADHGAWVGDLLSWCWCGPRANLQHCCAH
jgi:hypothetical protein